MGDASKLHVVQGETIVHAIGITCIYILYFELPPPLMFA